MRTRFKLLLSVLAVMAVAVLAFMGIELGVGLYDRATNMDCMPGGLSEPPQKLSTGINRTVLRNKHRTTGLFFEITGKALKQTDIDLFENRITGSLHALLGSETSRDNEWNYLFTLELNSSEKQLAVESILTLRGSPVALEERYDVQCFLKPSRDDYEQASSLHGFELPANTPLEITFAFDQPIPRNMELQIFYSRTPRSFVSYLKNRFLRSRLKQKQVS